MGVINGVSSEGVEETHIIGGNEEIEIMVRALQEEPDAKFILNVTAPVTLKVEIGTGINFEQKTKT